ERWWMVAQQPPLHPIGEHRDRRVGLPESAVRRTASANGVGECLGWEMGTITDRFTGLPCVKLCCIESTNVPNFCSRYHKKIGLAAFIGKIVIFRILRGGQQRRCSVDGPTNPAFSGLGNPFSRRMGASASLPRGTDRGSEAFQDHLSGAY